MPEVLVHYKFYHVDQIKDFIMDDNQMVHCILDDDTEETIMLKDAVKQRIITKQPPELDDQIFDNQLVRYGYALGMKKDPEKGRQIKIPKNEPELRNLFNFNDPKKASFWTNDYDVHIPITVDNYRHIFRGFFSSRGSVRPGNAGYVNISWGGYRDNLPGDDEEDNEDNNDKESLINKIREFSPCKIEYNGQSCFLQSSEQLEWFLTNIGFIQRSKLQQTITLCKSKMYKVTSLIPTTDNSFLYHYVHNYGEPEDYQNNRHLVINDQTVNYIDKANGKTPFHASFLKNRHNSLYPALWLLQNGANPNIGNRKSGTGIQSFFDEDLITHFASKKYFKELITELFDRNLFVYEPVFIAHTIHFIDFSHRPEYGEHYYEFLQAKADSNKVMDFELKKPSEEQIIGNNNIIKNLVNVMLDFNIRYRDSNGAFERNFHSDNYNEIIGMFEIIEQAIADGAPFFMHEIDQMIFENFNSIHESETEWASSSLDSNNVRIVDFDYAKKYDKAIYRDIILLLRIFDIPSKDRIMRVIKANPHYENLLTCYPLLR